MQPNANQRSWWAGPTPEQRLAFDNPTVIAKDDKTDYTFDTGIIEHVPQPRTHYPSREIWRAV